MKIYKAFLKDGKPVIESYKIQKCVGYKGKTLYMFNDTESIGEWEMDLYLSYRVVYSLIERRAIEIFERYEPFYF